jgi:cytochrome c-type biogenesis protein CcmH
VRDARSTSTSVAPPTSPVRSRRRCTATSSALVEGGYSAQEILDAFVETYGEVALMAPKREGFNWAGYLVPFGALAAGGAALVTVLRRMQQRAHASRGPSGARRASDARSVPPTSWRDSTRRSAATD